MGDSEVVFRGFFPFTGVICIACDGSVLSDIGIEEITGGFVVDVDRFGIGPVGVAEYGHSEHHAENTGENE
jgi:hypothetical protein